METGANLELPSDGGHIIAPESIYNFVSLDNEIPEKNH